MKIYLEDSNLKFQKHKNERNITSRKNIYIVLITEIKNKLNGNGEHI